MSDRQITELLNKVASLLCYQSLFDQGVGKIFVQLLTALERQQQKTEPSLQLSRNCLTAYGDWFGALAEKNQSWQSYLIAATLTDDNPFTQQVQRVSLQDISPSLVRAAERDLQILGEIANCDPELIRNWVAANSLQEVKLPAWQPEEAPTEITFLHQQRDWSANLSTLASYYRQRGTGLFGKYKALRWQKGQLWGISQPDNIQLDNLVGYEAQKATLVENTEFLLAGYPSLHVLLYGSRGSGKSSLIKALLSEYHGKGLRLVEVNKLDLQDLPLIVDRLRDVPQKFIIFVDDLSFEVDDDAFKALKVVLEGNVTARSPNIVVYATSNRRHLIREFFADRPLPRDNDEVHAWDTMQEKLSFSDRFGLTLTFTPADQDTYLQMVRHLACQARLEIDAEELEFRARQWATQHNGRSGRTAKQFVDFLQARANLLNHQ